MLYVFLIFLSATITTGLSIYSWQRRAIPGGAAFAALMLVGSLWLISIGCMLTRETAEAAIAWYRASLVGPVITPVVMLIFVSQYSARREWITPWRLIMLFILPVVTLLIIATDPVHRWFFQNITVAEKNGLMLLHTWTPGPWFLVNAIYGFGIIFAAIAWLLAIAIRQFHRYRMQSIAIIAATLAVVLPNFGFAFGWIPPDVIILPFCFLLMALFMTWGIFFHGLLDLVPVARKEMIDIMNDAMIVLNAENRVVDANPAALTAIGRNIDNTIGKSVEEVYESWPEIITRFLNVSHTETEFRLSQEGNTTHYDLRISTINDKYGKAAGRLILFQDITKLKNQQEALLRAKNKADKALRAAETSQRELESKNLELEKLNRELRSALDKIHRLEGILPICSFCKKIRDDRGGWNQLENYISARSQADFSHSICPECAAKHYPELQIKKDS